MVKAKGELVTAVSINGLEETDNDPNVHGQDVELASNSTPQNWSANRAKAKNHDFDRRRVFSCKTEGS